MTVGGKEEGEGGKEDEGRRGVMRRERKSKKEDGRNMGKKEEYG